MDQITNILYWLSTGLLIPVTLLLIFFLLRSLLLIGGFYGAYLSRNKVNTSINKKIDEGFALDYLATAKPDAKHPAALVLCLERIYEHRTDVIMLEKILGDYEIQSQKDLDRSKLLVKIGPMLGLMGTLIPMGPALVGLATGDVASMANNMQVAFATTVVGIIIGAVGFITLQVKQRWMADDMNILGFMVETLKKEQDAHE